MEIRGPIDLTHDYHTQLPQGAFDAYVDATHLVLGYGDVSRYAIGQFVAELRANIEQEAGAKFHLYAGHDSTLMPLQHVLLEHGIIDWSPYAAYLTIEVSFAPLVSHLTHMRFKIFADKASGVKFARVLYDGEAQLIRECSPGPHMLCPLDRVAGVLRDFSITREECEATNKADSRNEL